MQRFLTLIVLLLVSAPVGISLIGCQGSNVDANFCNGKGYGQKLSAVDSIDLEPAVNGISLAFGQTSSLTTPTAFNCKHSTASVSKYIYGTTNLNIADVSPSGAVCGGTWNRNSPGGITNFTICTPPAKAGTAFLTATAAGVTSNAVQVFVHPAITSVQLGIQKNPDGSLVDCVSQNKAEQLDAVTYVEGQKTPFCAPSTSGFNVPECSTNLGHFTYNAINSSIVSIDANGNATAKLPGSTAITATISSNSSTAGYWYTCAPVNIALSVPSSSLNPDGTVNVTQGVPVALTATATDKYGVTISGLTLDVESTNPQEISASSSQIASAFPGTATITAICQPPSCNPSPINLIGAYNNGSGVPANGIPALASNTLTAVAPGRSSQKLWMASPQSYFFTPIDLTTGTVGNPVKLPYIPNSMVMDQAGNNLYFGSYRELMTVAAASGSISKQDTNVPGVVLAVSPDSSTLLINDQIRKVLYLYTVSSGAYSALGGVAQQAHFSPDGKTVFAAGTDPDTQKSTLYVHNTFTGWSTSTITANQNGNTCATDNNLNNAPAGYASGTHAGDAYNPFCSPDVAITVPSAGVFVSGNAQTSAKSFCYNSTLAGNPTEDPYYPTAANVAAITDHLAATPDGDHILGASATTKTLTDIAVTIPTGLCPAVTAAPETFTTAPLTTVLAGINPSTIDGVIPTYDSSLAFVTYQSSGAGNGLLPVYKVGAKGALGTVSNIQLAGSAGAPISGIMAPDNTLFFTGTSGDNLLHFINVGTLKDTKQIDPLLIDPNGNPVPPAFLAVKTRPTT